jgi:hypothetical protein
MKQFYLFTTFLIISCLAFGKEIDENTAKQVGRSFLVNSTNSPTLKSTVSLKIAYRAGGKSGSSASVKASTYYYVFNVDSKGFVIVAGDDDVTPILGYSDESTFDPAHIPENVAKWLEGYKSEVRYILENHVKATAEITEAWTRLRNGQGYSTRATEKSVTPLVQTKWDQSPYYNDLCPYDNATGEKTVTGCVATAMAQIMKYWNYPEKGTGFHSYNHATYGTLSANFGNNTYQWASMPNSISSANSAIASLMYDVGVSVDMSYGPGSSGGSSAYVITAQSPVDNCSEYALKTYFGYKPTLKGVERENYSTSDWISLMKTEFDASRPVLYAGFGSGGGHCFVADGYDNNNYIHFNWGWGGYYDGYFEVSALNPGGLGTGGGTGGYNSGQQAVIGIEPVSAVQQYELNLYDDVSISSNPISYAQAFSVNTNLVNIGTGAFNGDYTAAVFDESYNFVDYIEIKTGYSLASGYVYNNNLVFSSAGMVTMLPGNYYIAIFSRPDKGEWTQVGNGDYDNMVPVTVTYSNDIELNSAIEVTPGNTITKGDEISVNLNILNNGSTTFTGQYAVELYNLNGDYVQTIDLMDETEGLPPGYTYLDPYLTFTYSSLDVEPGSYLLAVLHKPTGGNWQLTGSSNYQNPIQIIVKSEGMLPDVYEENDEVNNAWELPVAFSGNTAHVTSTGSNCHVGNDYDYYKIDLQSGYSYTIVPRLQDSYDSDDGNTYTLDAIFSMSPDGIEWTDTYDDVLNGEVVSLENGGTVYFLVSPYFTGETGTYMLDMTIERSPSSAVKENALTSLIRVYPNPAREHVMVDLGGFTGKLQKIELVDPTGHQVINPVLSPSGKSIDLSLNSLPEGIYFVRLFTDNGIITRKIIVKN